MALLDPLFKLCVEKGASDLHMSTRAVPMLRLDGVMQNIEGHPETTPEAMKKYLSEILPEKMRDEFEKTGDADFAYEIVGCARFRCNYFMDMNGMGGVFRVIPSKVPTVKELNLSQHVVDLCHLKKGLVLVTGPTGSGKSTTLAALINHINTIRNDHIITIEDPIEFTYANNKCLVNQRQVHRHTESFKKALRAALREDPDIVLVGEMRDLETIEIALETAETGHLVFATLHTNTAASAVDRIIDQFPSGQQNQIRSMLASALKAVIAQVLCRRIGKGRVAALEVLVVNNAVASNIREAKTHQLTSAMQVGQAIGMRLLNDALLDLVKSKTIDPMEGYLNSIDKKTFIASLVGAGFTIDTSKLGQVI